MQFDPFCRICGTHDLYPIHHIQFNKPEITTEDIFKQKLEKSEPYSSYIRLNLLFNVFLPANTITITLTLYRCPVCGFIFFIPCPDQQELMYKYQYFAKLFQNSKESPYLLSRQKRIFKLISSKGNITPSCKILDYGGSKGDSLHLFSPSNDCYVLDYSPIKKNPGINYIKGDLKSLHPDTKFNVIFLQHTLEHVFDPVNLVRELTGYLELGGILYIEVPLGCFREYREIKEPLTHINFFSEESIAYFAKRLNLNVLHLSTNFQYVIDRRDWCINCIVAKDDQSKDLVRRAKTTKNQMRMYYRIPEILEQMRLRMQEIIPLPRRDSECPK